MLFTVTLVLTEVPVCLHRPLRLFAAVPWYRVYQVFCPGLLVLKLSYRYYHYAYEIKLSFRANRLGAFTKLRKATIGFVMSVCPSLHMELLGIHWMNFHENWCLRTFRISVYKIQVSLKSDKNNVYFTTWRPIYILSYLAQSKVFSDKRCRENRCRENQDTSFVFSNIFFLENLAVSEILWKKKYCRAGQATVDNMGHMHCVLDTQGYKYTHSGCVIVIALPLHQWLHEGTSMLRYTYIVCISMRYSVDQWRVYVWTPQLDMGFIKW
jgi:hypothetical protein